MNETPKTQIESWLKKLERESWQLELLVSAFTIFLLLGANTAFEEFLLGLNFKYNMSGVLSIVGLFLLIIKNSIQALIISLVIHLMLRGFWIGTIGLRSVQSSVDFEKLKYNEFFTDKLRKNGVISLDRMVVKLDEICSVIFAFSFLIISVLIAFGMYLISFGLLGFILTQVLGLLPDAITMIGVVFAAVVALVYLIMGIIYMIDYLTLGFFKKLKWMIRIYYPFYRLFNAITLSRLSKSIYYYLISKFSKNRIRIVFSTIGGIVLFLFLFDFDQHQYFPEFDNEFIAPSNAYNDERPDEDYIQKISIPSKYIDKPFFPLFLRYSPEDNPMIRANCPNFEPLKDDGINSRMEILASNGDLHIRGKDYSDEDFATLLSCHSSIYQVSINDSIYSDLTFRFYTHPHKKQKGLLTVVSTDHFIIGENQLDIKKVRIDSAGVRNLSDFVQVPFWYNPN